MLVVFYRRKLTFSEQLPMELEMLSSLKEDQPDSWDQPYLINNLQ